MMLWVWQLPEATGGESVPLLPVLFFIHGGACLVGDGDSDIFGPDYFLDMGIVVVSINYRLGPFGKPKAPAPRLALFYPQCCDAWRAQDIPNEIKADASVI